MSNSPIIKDFFHEDTHTFSYVVSDPSTKACAIVDSVLDYDAASASTQPLMQVRLLLMSKSKV